MWKSSNCSSVRTNSITLCAAASAAARISAATATTTPTHTRTCPSSWTCLHAGWRLLLSCCCCRSCCWAGGWAAQGVCPPGYRAHCCGPVRSLWSEGVGGHGLRGAGCPQALCSPSNAGSRPGSRVTWPPWSLRKLPSCACTAFCDAVTAHTLRVPLKGRLLLLGSAAYADRAHATPVMLQRQCLPPMSVGHSLFWLTLLREICCCYCHPSLCWVVTPAPIAHGI